jgi:hypothetical protein
MVWQNTALLMLAIPFPADSRDTTYLITQSTKTVDCYVLGSFIRLGLDLLPFHCVILNDADQMALNMCV